MSEPTELPDASLAMEDGEEIDFPVIEIDEEEDEPELFDSESALGNKGSPSLSSESMSASALASTAVSSPSPSKKQGFIGRIFKRSSEQHVATKEEKHLSESKERHHILEEAQKLGMELKCAGGKRRHVTVIYNPVSGKGAAKRITNHIVVPILQICGLDFTVVETKYAGYATEFVRALDCTSTNAIIIAGGDGLVHEVITGYFEHPDQEAIKAVGVGIVPSGTANAMANTLHQHKSHSSTSLCGYATLAVCRGVTRAVDVIQVKTPKERIYCLSIVGWGISGAVARKAAKLRWIPGQKKARYDIAGFVMMLQDWPVLDRGLLSYPVLRVDDAGVVQTVWVRENIETVNLTASNLPKLGEDHPICRDITVDDGYMSLTSVGPEGGRKAVIKMAMGMKRGVYLADQAGVKSWKLKEFILEPFGDSKHDFNVDGDPLPPTKIHVKVLNKALSLFVEPPRDHSHDHGQQATAGGAASQSSPSPTPTPTPTSLSVSSPTSSTPSAVPRVSLAPSAAYDLEEDEPHVGDAHSIGGPRMGTIVLGDEDELPCVDCGEDYFDLFDRTQSEMPPITSPTDPSGLLSPLSFLDTESTTTTITASSAAAAALAAAPGTAAGDTQDPSTLSQLDPQNPNLQDAHALDAHYHHQHHRESQSFVRWPKIHRPNALHTREHLERKRVLTLADALGRRLKEENAYQRHITVIYNPVSGRGAAKRIVEHMVVPVLKLAGLLYTIVPTEYAGFATEFVQQINVSETNGLIIAGGDGLVHEVITGYYEHPDQATIRKLPVGIVPSGTANAMANAIHQHKSHSSTSLTGYAALAVASGTARKVDVIEIATPDQTIRCLSVIGWGLAGAVARKADQLRWIPGQKKARYDIAGFVTMMRDWPVLNRGKLRYAEQPEDGSAHPAGAEKVWKETDISLINMVASNLSKLGDDHPIYPNILPDDGRLALVVVDGDVSRRGVVGMAIAMKKGKFLGKLKRGVRTFITDEFYLEPDAESHTDYNIDGDPLPPCPIHVRCLKQDLMVFAAAGPGVEVFDAPIVPRKSSAMPWSDMDIDAKIPVIPTVDDEEADPFLEALDQPLQSRMPSVAALNVPKLPSSPPSPQFARGESIMSTGSAASLSVPGASASASSGATPSSDATASSSSSTSTTTAAAAAVAAPQVKCAAGLFAKECSDRKLVMKEAEAMAASLRAAGAAAASPAAGTAQPRRMTIIYNPVASKAIAKKVADFVVVPIFKMCGFEVTLVETKFSGFATDYVRALDTAGTDTLVVIGGDSLLHEVVTGYLTHPDQDAIHNIPIGIVPVGTNNAMANTLHSEDGDATRALVTGRAAMAICRGDVQSTDVLKCTLNGKTAYSVSMIGWGIAGAVARKAAKIRWMPEQKAAQYDVAALIAMIPEWPVVDKAKFSYPVVRRVQDKTEKVWVERDISVINLIATNTPEIGEDYPITRHIAPDDGHVAVVYIDEKASRGDLLRYAKAMKKGMHLADQKGVWSVKTTEFKLVPDAECQPHDFNIDGNPFPAGELHVQVLRRVLPLIVTSPPDSGADSDSEADSGVSSSSAGNHDGLLMEGGVVVSEEGFMPVEPEEDGFFDLFEEHECTAHLHDGSDASLFGGLDPDKRKRLFWPKIVPHIFSKEDRERNKILLEAQRLSAELHCTPTPSAPRRILIVYNPVSGAGIAKRLVEHMVLPVLDICGLRYEVIRTEYAGHARRVLRELEPRAFDGIIVSGGDGLVHEVISGYYENDAKAIRKVPIGICPAGTANAMANYLHRHHSHSHISLVGYGALAVARGTTRAVDVFSVETAKEKVHCLSVIGWGLAGAVARKAAQLRWIPGQKKARYDIAGFVTMLQDWPLVDRANFKYLTEEKGADGEVHEVWKEDKLNLINMVATNLPKLGEDHPIYPDIAPDDGFMAVVVINEGVTRKGVVNLAMKMKKGKYLGLQRGVRSFKTREFILEPVPESKTDLLVDGDPLAPTRIHVTVLNKGLRLFAELDPASIPPPEAAAQPKISYV